MLYSYSALRYYDMFPRPELSEDRKSNIRAGQPATQDHLPPRLVMTSGNGGMREKVLCRVIKQTGPHWLETSVLAGRTVDPPPWRD